MLEKLRGGDGQTTRQLAGVAHDLRYEDLDAETLLRASQSILDFLGLMISSADQPLVSILVEEALEQDGRREASAVGAAERMPAMWAATVNSAAGHGLAYDDVNMVVPGHGTAVALPASLALAERAKTDGRGFLTAFVAGFETVCRCGELVEPSHYDAGFHASATIGTLGSAASAARILGLDLDATTQALSLAFAMAAGTKGAFGTMVKPFQVARAAGNGVLAASLASRGLKGRGDLFECAQGFAATHMRETLPARLPDHAPGDFLKRTLFKYHAACYLAHAPIEGALAIRGMEGFEAAALDRVTVTVHPMAAKVCNIDRPSTGPEIGYSIRMLTAMSLLGHRVTKSDDLSPRHLEDRAVMTLLDRVTIAFDKTLPDTAARVNARAADGTAFEQARDVGTPETDLAAQGAKVEAKVRALVEPLLGPQTTAQLIDRAANLADLRTLDPIAELLRRPAEKTEA